MTSLINALQTENTFTENGMVTNSSSSNSCVDLFFNIGAMRGQSKQKLISAFSKAFNEYPQTAMKILFWARDIRGGAGERQIFRDIMSYLAENHTSSLLKNIHLISEYGRWDDVVELIGTKVDAEAKQLIAKALESKNGLCAKWCPRKGEKAIALERYLKLSPKEYRKMIVKLTNVVEQQMCSNEWEKITYEHVPSVAIARYAKAFGKHDNVRFGSYITSDKKINSGAVYPYDVTKTLNMGDANLAMKQWDSLPNYLVDNKERLLPMCDVSGSMQCLAGNNKNVTALDVCLSLGLYISERNVGIFKDAFITFSAQPELQLLKGNLSDRFRQLRSAHWEMNTNLEAAFTMILNQAVKHNVPESEMPTTILILSDMEFDGCVRYNASSTAFKMIIEQYKNNGYNMPKVVFWNLNSHGSNVPVTVKDKNVALVSGFSPAILKSLLSGEDMTPTGIMLKTLNSPRYVEIRA
jgi:hypothetical protein